MESSRRSPVGVVVAGLAVVQGVLGILAASRLIEAGRELAGEGTVLLPVIGAIVVARGVFVTGLGLLYGAFAWGVVTGRRWARRVGLVAAAVNLVLVAALLFTDGWAMRSLAWVIVPVVVGGYLLAPAGGEVADRARS